MKRGNGNEADADFAHAPSGGFERVCVTTARLMEPYFDVVIVIFNSANIAYDVEGLNIIDVHLGVQKGKVKKSLRFLSVP